MLNDLVLFFSTTNKTPSIPLLACKLQLPELVCSQTRASTRLHRGLEAKGHFWYMSKGFPTFNNNENNKFENHFDDDFWQQEWNSFSWTFTMMYLQIPGDSLHPQWSLSVVIGLSIIGQAKGKNNPVCNRSVRKYQKYWVAQCSILWYCIDSQKHCIDLQ